MSVSSWPDGHDLALVCEGRQIAKAPPPAARHRARRRLERRDPPPLPLDDQPANTAERIQTRSSGAARPRSVRPAKEAVSSDDRLRSLLFIRLRQ
jgi:hypothetical protein